ncbi:MAG: hypothetical protein AAGC47_00095 [Bacteroidota bacterium]
MKLKYSIILLVAGLMACNKDELPDDISGSPEFVSNLQINGQDLTLTAGQNGLVLYSELNDLDTSITFLSGYENGPCNGCSPRFELAISNPPDFLWDSNTNWVEALSSWELSFENEVELEPELFVNIESGNPFAQGFWIVNGQILGDSPSSSFDLKLDTPGSYQIQFLDSMGVCASGPPNTVTWDGISMPCYASISMIDDGVYQAFPSGAYGGFANYFWTLDGDTVSIDSIADVNIPTGILCARPVVPSGCDFETCIDLSGTVFNCVGNTLILSDSIVVSIGTQNTALTQIEFSAPNGEIYSTDGDQSNSQISLLSLTPYEEPNMPELSFLKARYQLACVLYDQTGNSLFLSGIAEVAWQLPE